MSVSGVREASRRKKSSVSTRARRNAMKDIVPDRQLPGGIKRIPAEDEPAAESDEEDD
jgi:hypothetical protein